MSTSTQTTQTVTQTTQTKTCDVEVVHYSKLKDDKIIVVEPQKNVKFFYSHIFYKKNDNPLIIQSPTLKDVILHQREAYINIDDSSLYRTASNVDTACKKKLQINSEKWFGKKLSDKQVDDMFHINFDFLKIPNKILFRCVINPDCDIYDEKNNIIQLSNLTPNKIKYEYVFLIQPLYIKLLKSSASVVWIVRQIKVFAVKPIKPDPLPKKSFIDDNLENSDEDDNDNDNDKDNDNGDNGDNNRNEKDDNTIEQKIIKETKSTFF